MRTFDVKTTTSFVVANMIGTGVFTSLGYQILSTPSTFALLMLWVIGGIASFCGALSYVSLASILPRSGGEYHYLSQIYGKAFGFVAGFITVLIGFAAPIALAAIAFGSYLQHLFPLDKKVLAIIGICSIASIHMYSTQKGGIFHYLSTLLKMLLIILFIIVAFPLGNPQPITLFPVWADLQAMTSPSYAVSFIYVTYSYTGWNAAVYILDEVKEPKKTIPIAILLGTTIVMICYLLLNFAFLYTTPLSAMAGKEEVGHIVAQHIFGEQGAMIMSALIGFGLIAALSSMMVTGSRVLKVMTEDYVGLNFLNKTNENGSPYLSILVMAVLAIFFVLSATFDVVLTYVGVILSIFGATTVLGLFLYKHKHPTITLPFGKWFYPFVPALYIAIKIWIVGYLLYEQPASVLAGLLTILLGFISYLFLRKKSDEQ